MKEAILTKTICLAVKIKGAIKIKFSNVDMYIYSVIVSCKRWLQVQCLAKLFDHSSRNLLYEYITCIVGNFLKFRPQRDTAHSLQTYTLRKIFVYSIARDLKRTLDDAQMLSLHTVAY
jgi:hypothetical protein